MANIHAASMYDNHHHCPNKNYHSGIFYRYDNLRRLSQDLYGGWHYRCADLWRVLRSWGSYSDVLDAVMSHGYSATIPTAKPIGPTMLVTAPAVTIGGLVVVGEPPVGMIVELLLIVVGLLTGKVDVILTDVVLADVIVVAEVVCSEHWQGAVTVTLQHVGLALFFSGKIG
ncbi:hypothetical protein SCUP515_05937 [Seiridium cupressi]